MSATPHHISARPVAYRVREGCEALGISRAHLYALEKRRKIRLVRVGGRTLIPTYEIDRLVREGA
jgi:excisionase family DNA binding protein